MSAKVPILVVLGTDVEGKWHASRFDDSELALVKRAADLMGFYLVRVGIENAELHALAEALPVGKIFASGKAFVPFVAGPVFQKLAPLTEGGMMINTERAAADDPSAKMNQRDATTTADMLWSKIEIGTMVLADQPELYGPGWWQCVVVAADGEDLTLRWVDDPSEAPFRASRRAVGLRHPNSADSAAS